RADGSALAARRGTAARAPPPPTPPASLRPAPHSETTGRAPQRRPGPAGAARPSTPTRRLLEGETNGGPAAGPTRRGLSAWRRSAPVSPPGAGRTPDAGCR